MSRALEKYLDRVMIYANRKEEDTAKIRVELKDHLLKKIDDLEGEGLSRDDAIRQSIKDHGHSRIVGFGLRKRFVRLKVYILVALILLVVDYSLLLGRFYWFGFGTVSTWVYKVINFPCSFLYLWLEKKPNQWWYGVFGRHFEFPFNQIGILYEKGPVNVSFGEFLFNDEIGVLLAGVILTLFQASLITALFLRLKIWRQDIEVSGV